MLRFCDRRTGVSAGAWTLRVCDWGTGVSAGAWMLRVCDWGTGVSASAWTLRICDRGTGVPQRPALRLPESWPPKYQDFGRGVLSSWKELAK